jgi:hypothetical protein
MLLAAGKRRQELLRQSPAQEGTRPDGVVASTGSDGGDVAGEGRSGGGV